MHVLRRDQDGDDLQNEPRIQHLPLADRADVYLFGANFGLRMQVVFGYDLLDASRSRAQLRRLFGDGTAVMYGRRQRDGEVFPLLGDADTDGVRSRA